MTTRRHRAIGLLAVALAAAQPALADEPGPVDASPWRLQVSQVADPDGLLRRLADRSDPLSAWLYDRCAPETRGALAGYRAPPPAALLEAVVADLNRALDEPGLYAPARFAGVPLSLPTEALLAREPAAGGALQELNRRLLEDAYADELEPAWRLPCYVQPGDIRRPRDLAQALRNQPDPVSHDLRQRLGAPTRAQLQAFAGDAPGAELLAGLVAALNHAIQDESFYTPARFEGVRLDPRTRALLDQAPRGETRELLNRMLLEDAYPGLLRRLAPAPLDIQADSLEYDESNRLMIATGRARVSQGAESVRGDHAVINMQTHDVLAKGHVVFDRENDQWTGDTLRYNFKTHRGDFGPFRAYLEPFYVQARSSQRVAPDRYELRHVRLAPCEGDRPEAYFRARRVWITPGRHVRAQHVVLFVKGVPVMYAPFWNQNIGDRNFISLVPGYSSRMYAYLLTAFNYRLAPRLEAATHVDLRARRGVGVGQDLLWSSSGNAKGLSAERYAKADDDYWVIGRSGPRRHDDDEPDDDWAGDLTTYYAHDDWPDEGKRQDYELDAERYRLRLYHTHSFEHGNYLIGQANYLSDPKVIEQFFRDEYKSSPEPENYLVLGHRGDRYTATMRVDKRLNDYYDAVDRIPELTLDFSRRKLGATPLYYQGALSGGWLDRLWEQRATNREDYAVGRFDGRQMLYYPTKQLGFLNVIPRGGWHGTYYSKTKEDVTNVTVTATTATNGVTTTRTNTTVTARERDAEFRSRPELGLETSFKAFKVWETYPGDVINNLRHIAEPYADYTYAPEPNVTSNQLYYFDELDTLGEANEVRLGLRNKIQTQRFNKQQLKRHDVYDLINADAWTTWYLSPEDDQDSFRDVGWDVRSRPFDWIELRLDGAYDLTESQLDTFNTRLSVRDRTFWNYAIEHRHREGSSSLLTSHLSFSPTAAWSYGLFGRYEFETSTLESWGVSVQRSRECLTWKLGVEQQVSEDEDEGEDDDEFTVWLQFWFTRFPTVRVDAGL